jgi:hypothetical protein
MQTRTGRAIFTAALIVTWAGCAAKPPAEEPYEYGPDELPPGVTNILEGIVKGPELFPLEGALVKLNGFEENRTTDEGGYYRFESLPPRDYTITASKEGYRPKAQRAILEDDKIFQLDFVLEEVPLERPYDRTQDFRGLISCQAAYQTNPDTTQRPNCGSNDPQNKQFKDFDFGPGAAQIQIELLWEPASSAAKILTITVESLGDNAIQFAHDRGESPIKAVVSQSLVTRNLPDGGRIRVLAESAPSVTGDESALDVGLALQQPFVLYFTVFYIEPGPPNFSAIPK